MALSKEDIKNLKEDLLDFLYVFVMRMKEKYDKNVFWEWLDET